MAKMTDEEAAALDEKWTQTIPRINLSRPGVFARQRVLLEALDELSANYIQNRAEAAQKTPAEIIGDLVREKIAATT
jgi:hypothetical protein